MSVAEHILLQIVNDIPLQTVLQSSSTEAEDINHVTSYFFIAAGLILFIVVALIVYVLYQFREGKATGKEPVHSRKWEIAMIGIPSLLVAYFLYLNIKTINEVEPPHSNEVPDVIVIAHQWWWEAKYPSSNVTTANEIHLPSGRKILLKLITADVIHDWWIPSFGNKMDMIPHQENYIWLNIKHPGDYFGICSEFCGAQHAHMRLKVVAQEGNDFNNWLTAHREPAVSVTGSGAQLFMEKTCGNCHRINGTKAQGLIGPDLTHLASRKTLLAGLLNNNLHSITDWIRDPQHIKPGANMPDFHLNDSTIHDIALYLNSLK